MQKLSRRDFVKAGIAGVSALSAGAAFSGFSYLPGTGATVDKVELGRTGLKVSRLAFGTGTSGYGGQSAFTSMGINNFLKLTRLANERGITFFDTADAYGTHTSVARVFKEVPRDRCQIMTKIWTENNSWNRVVPVNQTLDRFRKELDTDYMEIVLLHCLTSGDWPQTKAKMRDELTDAKAKGIVTKIGVSCHDYNALKVAVDDPWVDVILARINPGQKSMDGTPQDIMSLLKRASDNGKGVLGMKIFGAGQWNNANQRQESLEFAVNSGNVHAMTIGMINEDELNDTVDRLMAVV